MGSLLSNEKYSLYYQRINLIYQRPEVKASLEIILSVFTVTLLIFAAIRPTLTNITALQKRIEDLDSTNRKADSKITQVFNAQSQLNTYADRLNLFDRAVPDGFSYSDIAGRIEVLARRKGLEVETIITPGVRLFGTGKGAGEWALKIIDKDPSNILRAQISFVVNGNPDEVRSFLQEIENLDRATFLNSVILTAERGPGNTGQVLKAAGQIYFYFYQEP